MTRRPLHVLALAALALFAGFAIAPLAVAQTPSVVLTPDSALLIAKMPNCTTACPDSIRITWVVGAQRISKIVKAKATDTTAVRRVNAGTRGADLLCFPYAKVAAAKSVALWRTDSLFEYSWPNGGRVRGPIALQEGDSLRATFVIVQPNGTKMRPHTSVQWNLGPGLTLRGIGDARFDSVWVVALRTSTSG